MHPSPLALLAPPYVELRPLEPNPKALRTGGLRPGAALVWCMDMRNHRARAAVVRARPGGLSLLVVLPAECDLDSSPGIAAILHPLRPHGILPYHPDPSSGDLAQVLRRPPADLGADVIDYIRWRGLVIDRDTVRILRRILDLSAELRSITAVSRSMYLSRRALGRRLATRGLPVPSHWLQVGRLLRVAIELQNTESTVSSAAFGHGYPDGFSLSNQMERLIGYRPSEARNHLGWEWMVESWLQREAAAGNLAAASSGRTGSPPGSPPRPTRELRSHPRRAPAVEA